MDISNSNSCCQKEMSLRRGGGRRRERRKVERRRVEEEEEICEFNHLEMLRSSFKIKKKRKLYRRTIINNFSSIIMSPSSISKFTTNTTTTTSLLKSFFPLFLIFVVISSSSLPLNSNLKCSIFAQASNSPDTRQISATSTTTSSTTTTAALSTAQSQATNTSFFTNNNQTSTTTSNTASSSSSSITTTSISPSERLLNLVKTNFANQTTNGRFVPSKVRSVGSYGQQREHQQFETAYACEGNRIDLSCRGGKLIHVVRANYGRFSLSICNELVHSNLSTDCASFRAFLPMQNRCNEQSSCSVNVSKELFGDPCENTPKYLEVQYYCKDVNNNNNGNNNNNNQAGANSGSQTIATSSTSTTTTINNGNIQQANVVGKPTSQQQNQLHHSQQDSSAIQTTPNRINVGHKSQPQSTFTNGGGGELTATNMATNNGEGFVSNEDSILTTRQHDLHATNSVITQQQQQQQQINNNFDQYCPPQSSLRNLYWNYTRAGSIARQACPEGSSGKVSWFCDQEKIKFLPAWSPDFTQCKSNWLTRLANQLDRMLEMPSKSQLSSSSELLKQQNEQILKVVLNDLSLMARTKELFSEDLKRIDIMISQIITQIRSLSALYGNNWRSSSSSSSSVVTSSLGQTTTTPNQNSFNSLYEDLFNKLVNIVSSLFDVSQKTAWLDIQPNEVRKKLEQRFLNHLKDSGILLANSANQLNPMIEFGIVQPFRQANVFAAITVINNGLMAHQNSRFSPLNTNLMDSEGNSEFSLLQQLKQQQQQQQATNLNNKFTTTFEDNYNNQISDFKIHSMVLRELVANGLTKFLVFDIRKPDYSLIKQQLESTYAATAASAAATTTSQTDGNFLDNNLISEQQWTSRVFGVFAITGENGDVLDGQQQHANSQIQNKLTDILAQWPISVDFKLMPSGLTSNNPAVIATSSSNNNNQAIRQCNSLSDNVNQQQQQNRCQTLTFNATNHICRCDQFGFVSLSSNSNQQVPTSFVGDIHWPPIFGGSSTNNVGTQMMDNTGATNNELLDSSTLIGSSNNLAIPSYIAGTQTQNKQQQSLGIWSTIFVVFGISLLVVSFVAFLVNFILKNSSQNRLSKKQAAFSTTSILNHHRANDCLNGVGSLSTTGPLTDHSLIGNIDPIIHNHHHQHTQVNHHNSASGLTGTNSANATAYHNSTYKQLYTSHLPPIEVCSNPVKRWTNWLKPSCWPHFLSLSGKGIDQRVIEHRIIGQSSIPGSVSYKSQFQNGYTTALHHSHQSTATSQLPLAAPSSSTSSYVSSSAYYEEIGPGNLTKFNPNQLASNNNTRNTHTVVDPFKRHHNQAPADQQQLLTSSSSSSAAAAAATATGTAVNHQQQQQQSHIHHQWQAPTSGQSATGSAAATTTTALSYSLDSQQQQQQQSSYLNYGQPLSAIFKQQQQQQHNNDLNQVQSSSASSATSQHSASTSVTTANGSTPRHYLFASPSAVNAYKSSMSQQTLLNHHHIHHHQQQQQPFSQANTQYQQEQFKQDQHNHNQHQHHNHHHHSRQFMQN